jgi:tetratricopeptide (TPR) repeat protein
MKKFFARAAVATAPHLCKKSASFMPALRAPMAWRRVALGMTAAGALAGGAALAAMPVNPMELSEIDAQHALHDLVPRKQLYDRLNKLALQHDEDAAVLWRAARAAYAMATEPGMPKSDAKKYLDEALKYIKAAVRQNNDSGDAHRWYGTILSEYGNHLGTKEYIQNAWDIKAHWDAAIAVNPSDASAHHLLGRWCFDVAGMGWVKRRLAATLFATPPEASYDDALRYFDGAERLDPGFWKMNQVMLAKTHVAMGNKSQAEFWVKSALALASRSQEDREAHTEAEGLAKSLGMKL